MRRGGRPSPRTSRAGRETVATTSTTPPSVSRSRRAASVAARILTGRLGADFDRPPQTSIPSTASSHTAPRRRGRRCRADALERAADVLVAVLQHPREVGVPRSRERDRFAPLPDGSPRAATGSSPTSSSRGRGSSRRARGVPSVSPCRSPASTSTCPTRALGAGCARIPAGAPEVGVDRRPVEAQTGGKVRIATSARPCDSPAVVSPSLRAMRRS